MRRSKQYVRKDAGVSEPLEPLLTIEDVTRLLQISRPMIYVLIDQGLPIMKFGRAVRIAPGSLQRFLVRREQLG